MDLLIKKIKYVINYNPEDLSELPEISNDELITILEHSNTKTESFLIEYYNSWLLKSKLYKDDYNKGINEKDSRKSEVLIKPFQVCNLNCYKILLALDSLKSNYVDTIRLQNHYSFLNNFDKRTSLYRSGDFINYNKHVNCDTLFLQNGYNSIGDIDFEKEPELKELQKGYNETFCRKFVMYNGRTGYFDLGCQSGPLAGHGIMYKLELINNNKLKKIEIIRWIS